MSPKVRLILLALSAATATALAPAEPLESHPFPAGTLPSHALPAGRWVRPARPSSLERILERARSQSGIPGIVAVVLRSDSIVEVAASGVRRQGELEEVTPEDLFHQGNVAKIMTATLVGSLVDDRLLSWNTTPLELFPEWEDSVLSEYREVTIADLLAHRSGLAPYDDDGSPEFLETVSLEGAPMEQRAEFARRALGRKPVVPPQMKTLYSDGGYVVAAAMAERAAGVDFETLLEDRIFEPLDMHPIAGWPAQDDPDQPWGHEDTQVGGLTPRDPADAAMMRPLFAPANGLSMTLDDMAKLLQLHLSGLEGHDGLLRMETIARLHALVDGKVGMGWLIREVKEQQASTRAGRRGTFFSTGRVYAPQDLGVAVFANMGGPRAARACIDVMDEVARLYDVK